MIDLSDSDLSVIKEILNREIPQCEVRAFGSRVNGSASRFSDLDIVLAGNEKAGRDRIRSLKDAFSESDLPMTVDVLDWHDLSPEFRKIIEKNYIVLQNR